jgi:signal transduction histidine kinase
MHSGARTRIDFLRQRTARTVWLPLGVLLLGLTLTAVIGTLTWQALMTRGAVPDARVAWSLLLTITIAGGLASAFMAWVTRFHQRERHARRVYQIIARARAERRLRAIEDRNDARLEAERVARAELEHVGRMKDEFLATLSHELRAPLNAILGWAHILRQSGELSGRQAEGLEAIERNARVQAQLVSDLLDMSRIVSGTIRIDERPMDLRRVVEAAITTVMPAARAKEIVLEKTIDPGIGPMLGDPARLQQVVWNLLNNAVKFTPQGGRVSVTLQRTDGGVEIIVKDTGVGISQSFLPHVFDRFRQADASSTRRHYGLGIGLSIVKQLVELHGGTVTATSQGEGLGATFTVTLPLASAQEARAQRPATTMEPQ